LKGLKANLADPGIEKKAIDDSKRDILIIEEEIGLMKNSRETDSQYSGSVSNSKNSSDDWTTLQDIWTNEAEVLSVIKECTLQDRRNDKREEFTIQNYRSILSEGNHILTLIVDNLALIKE
jgi:hypothetical protein